MARLLSSLPVGALVKDIGTTYNGQPIIWQVMEHGHEGDPEGSTALISQKIITIKCFDAPEPENSSKNVQQYGNSHYMYSNIRQWLNSDAEAGKWYSPQHSADAPPTGTNEYEEEKGFLAYFSNELKTAIFTVEKKAYYEELRLAGYNYAVYETVSDKVFLLGCSEIGIEISCNINGETQLCDEGKIYELFNADNNRIAYPTPEAAVECGNGAIQPATPGGWWIRTGRGSDFFSFIVDEKGKLSSTNPHTAAWNGARPAIVVQSSIYVSDTIDSDGTYTISWNPPTWTITGEDISLGNVWQTPVYTYQVSNGNAGDRYVITEAIDEQTVRKITDVTSNIDITADFSGFEELANEEVHVYTITVVDANGAMEVRTLTFTKLGNKIVLCTNVVDTDEAAEKIIVEVNYTTENNPAIKVEVTNNAKAVNPTWENMTEELMANTFHEFENKPTEDFGVSVRVSLTKNAETERIYVYSIGFSFY